MFKINDIVKLVDNKYQDLFRVVSPKNFTFLEGENVAIPVVILLPLDKESFKRVFFDASVSNDITDFQVTVHPEQIQVVS